MLSSNLADHANMLNKGQYAFIADEMYLKTVITKFCDLQIGKELLDYDPYAIGFQNNSAYLDLFSEQ